MTDWTIKEINNAIHTVTLVHADGELLSLIVPAEHAVSSAVKMAWIKEQAGARSIAKAVKVPIEEVKADVLSHPKVLYFIAIIETIIIAALFAMRHK